MKRLFAIIALFSMLTCHVFGNETRTYLVEYSDPYRVASDLKQKIKGQFSDIKTLIITVNFKANKQTNFKRYHEAHDIATQIETLFDPEKTRIIIKLNAVENGSQAYKLTLTSK